MNLTLSFDSSFIDWFELANLLELAPLGKRVPAQLQRAFEKSFLCCFAYDGNKLIGTGRIISDGEYYAGIFDVAVLPEYQGKGVGQKIMTALLDKQKIEFIFLTSTVSKEQFYKKCGFRRHKTAMAMYRGSKKERENTYLE